MSAQTGPEPNSQTGPHTRARPVEGVTWRVLLLVLALLPLNSYFQVYLHGRQIVDPTIVAPFWNVLFALVLLRLVNGVASRLWPRRAFSAAEQACFFILLTVAAANIGIGSFWTTFSVAQGPHHFASPENQWERHFFEYLPEGLIVKDQGAIERLWRGGQSFFTLENLQAWQEPILRWWLLYIALWSAPIGMAVIIRRRWVESERLGFPVAQLPLEVAQRRLPAMRLAPFWIAIGLTVLINLLNGLHVFYPMVPEIPVKAWQSPALNLATYIRGRPWDAALREGFTLSFYPFIVGLGLLLPADLNFSLWVFYLQWKTQLVLSAAAGVTLPEFPYMRDQSFGAYLALGLLALWLARPHLRTVWQGITGERPGVDRDEPLSYRGAALLILVSFAYLVLVGLGQRLGLAVAVWFFIQYFLMTLIVGRIRAEIGVPAHELEFLGPGVTLGNIFGARILGPQQLTSMTVLFGFTRGMRNIPFPAQLEGLYLADRMRFSGRRLLLASMLMIAVGQLVAWIWALQLGYHFGQNTPWGAWMNWRKREMWDMLVGWLTWSGGLHWGRLAATGFGFAFYLLNMMARTRWVGYPLHPIGYAVGTTYNMRLLWFPMLLAWGIKSATVRYLGARSLPHLRAAAIGLVLGDVISGGLWILYGLATRQMTYAFWP